MQQPGESAGKAAFQIPTLMVVHDDCALLPYVCQAVKSCGPIIAYVSRSGWDGSAGNYGPTVEALESEGAEIVLGDWPNENFHRQSAMAGVRERLRSGDEMWRYIMTLDGDEVPDRELLSSLRSFAAQGIVSRVRCTMDTYWQDVEHRIAPRERLMPTVMVNVDQVQHVRIREFTGGKELSLGPEFGILHHLSYVRSDEALIRKISTWGHKNEVLPGWYQRCWAGYRSDITLRNVHPTHPEAFGCVERIIRPEALSHIPLPEREAVSDPQTKQTVSAVIPAYGGNDDLRQCIKSFQVMRDLVDEVIVVGDCGPEDPELVTSQFDNVTLIRNDKNLGYAGASNVGIQASTGKLVLLSNSDIIMNRPAMAEMLKAMECSGSIGAVGPVSNCAWHHQRSNPTYQSLETMPLFAEDLALNGPDPEEVDMLVGFCMLVRRSVLDEVGLLDAETFRQPNFEDNDLSFRIRSESYTLAVCHRAFVYHIGSRSISRLKEHPAVQMAKNRPLYEAKHADAIDLGFASHLSGLQGGRITFNPLRKPALVRKQIKRLAKRARITLVMIVRDESRCIREALQSAIDSNIFCQIVVVDTGSKDDTEQIARSMGVEVYEHPWEDSFSVARNQSISYATGDFIFWMDADDYLSLGNAEKIVKAAVNASPDVTAFVIPVRFLEGHQVDHVKLIRNFRGLAFSNRVHEQVLPSIHRHGGAIVRLAAFILHKNYDASPAGQLLKRERDEKLLMLDVQEQPLAPFPAYNVGMTRHFQGCHESAIEWLQRSIDLGSRENSHVRQAYKLMGISTRELGQLAGSLAIFDKGISEVGNDPELQFNAAIVLGRLNRLEESLRRYEVMEPLDGAQFSSIDPSIFTYKRDHNMAETYLALGRNREAKERLKSAMEAGFAPGAELAVVAALGLGDIRFAREAHTALLVIAGPCERWVTLGLAICAETGEPPELFLRGYLERSPFDIAPKLAFCQLLLEQGRFAEALPQLEEAAHLGSQEAARNLAVTYANIGQFEKSLETWRRVLEFDTENLEAQAQVQVIECMLTETA